MAEPSSEAEKWSEHEMKMINTTEIFLHKPAIMKKVEGCLNGFRDAMADELSSAEHPFPTGTDLIKGQLVRGENHKGFPFLSMDIPQFFSKTEMFTFRTLFWWGHCLVFSLILKGEKLDRCLEALLKSRHDPFWNDVYLAATPTPWEWSLTGENYWKVAESDPEDLSTLIGEIQYMKLCRFYPVDGPSFPTLDWTLAGLQAWKGLSQITKI